MTDKESWEQTHGYGRWHLSTKARHELRSQIRKEENDRFERLGRWITLFTGIIAALVGLVGALIEFACDSSLVNCKLKTPTTTGLVQLTACPPFCYLFL